MVEDAVEVEVVVVVSMDHVIATQAVRHLGDDPRLTAEVHRTAEETHTYQVEDVAAAEVDHRAQSLALHQVRGRLHVGDDTEVRPPYHDHGLALLLGEAE